MFKLIVMRVVLAALLGALPRTPPESDQEVQGQLSHQIESAVLQIVETVEIPATATGPLSKIAVQQGALITESQVLATIDDTDMRLKLQESEIELSIAKAQSESNVDVDFARKSQQVSIADYRRAQDSNQKYAGVVSDREMDRLKLLVEQSAAELEKIKFEKSLLGMQQQLKMAAVEKTRNAVERHKIRSVIAGQVIEIAKRKGEWVNLADPVFKVVRLDRLRVEEYVPVDVAGIQIIGAAATFLLQDSKQKEKSAFPGKVVFVSPEINPLNATVLVWIEFENPELRLRPGMKGMVTVNLQETVTDSTSASR